MTKFKIVYDIDVEEFQVLVFENGNLNPRRTYFASDKADAVATAVAMEIEDLERQVA